MIQVEIVTPHRKLLSIASEGVTLPGLEGEFEVLEGHTPMLVALKAGVLALKEGQRMMVAEGFAEIDHDKVNVLVETVALPEEIHLQTEEALIAEWTEKAKTFTEESDGDFELLQLQIKRAAAKLQV